MVLVDANVLLDILTEERDERSLADPLKFRESFPRDVR
jgi:hypothetical protein